MSSPVIHIRPRDRQDAWLRVDLREDDDVEAMIVIPAFGRDHHALLDCWCCPELSDGMVVHNAEN
jgi:hypothetical protein